MRRSLSRSLRDWLPDEDARTVPISRETEFWALAVAVPVLALFGAVRFDQTWPLIETGWAIAALGSLGGFCYAVYYREDVLSLVPEDVGGWTLLSLFGGGLGFTVLEMIPVTATTILFAVAFGGTVLALYLLWYLSPLHEGFEPAPRGAEPPSAIESSR